MKIMHTFSLRQWVGLGLILWGVLGLLEQIGLPFPVGDWFLALIFLAGAFRIGQYIRQERGSFLALLGMWALLGLGLGMLLPPAWHAWDGVLFLAALGIAFWHWHWQDGAWWSLFTGGVLFSLAVVALVEDVAGGNGDGIFLAGLGLSFLLVALRSETRGGENRWAYVPAVVLLVLSSLASPLQQWAGRLWPALLILAGLTMLWSYFRDSQNT